MAQEGASLPLTPTMTHTQTGVKTTSAEENADDELVTRQDYRTAGHWGQGETRSRGPGGVLWG